MRQFIHRELGYLKAMHVTGEEIQRRDHDSGHDVELNREVAPRLIEVPNEIGEADGYEERQVHQRKFEARLVIRQREREDVDDRNPEVQRFDLDAGAVGGRIESQRHAGGADAGRKEETGEVDNAQRQEPLPDNRRHDRVKDQVEAEHDAQRGRRDAERLHLRPAEARAHPAECHDRDEHPALQAVGWHAAFTSPWWRRTHRFLSWDAATPARAAGRAAQPGTPLSYRTSAQCRRTVTSQPGMVPSSRSMKSVRSSSVR